MDSNGSVLIFWDGKIRGTLGVFTKNFLQFLPAMMVIIGLWVAHSARLLGFGRHTPLTNGWMIFSLGAELIVNILMLSSFPLIALQGLQALGLAGGIVCINGSINQGVRIILILTVIGTSVNIIKRLMKDYKSTVR